MPTLLDCLIARYPTAKRQTFKEMLASGRIQINGKRPASLRVSVAETDQLTVASRQTKTAERPAKKLPFEIVFEDADLLVIDKPAGLLTSTNEREKRPTAWAMIQEHLQRTSPVSRPGLIHRLDRDAAGLLIFSKNDSAFRNLKQQFMHHTVLRQYIAHVHGKPDPPSGRLESHLIEGADGVVRATRRRGAGQLAITNYETTGHDPMGAILRVTLETGRKHQIRTQLAAKGTPIRNDPLYGEKPCEGPLMLVAVELQVDHPRTGKRMKFARS
jgi:23S rRNA pseudouridine1911/1915/1917 synthase